jgi:hypothetical protein
MHTVTTIPPASHGRRRWTDIAAVAKKVAPEWLVLEDEHARHASRMRQGQVAGFKDTLDWMIVTRNNTKNNKCTIYIKYVGK